MKNVFIGNLHITIINSNCIEDDVNIKKFPQLIILPQCRSIKLPPKLLKQITVYQKTTEKK